MQPEALGQNSHSPGWRSWPAAWRSGALALSLTWLALIALFHDDWAAMARQWWDSSTYTHILLVPFVIAWLVSIRAPQLERLSPSGWWPGLAGFGAALGMWLIGSLGGLASSSQAGAVAMLVAAAMTLFGPKVSAALAFPLGYMAFLVPFGDELIPLMQLVTAKLTIALVQFSGVRASIDGVFIDTPAGLFEVAEACSGVKFLIAMAAFGVLVANVCFRSWSRRIAFVFLALALPIFANGLRAWGTVFAAQYVGADKASGIDHLVYGWIFFALVMVATLAMGWRFFDRAPDDAMVDAAALESSPRLTRLEGLRIGTLEATLAMAALAMAFFAWASAAERLRAPLPAALALPAVQGWERVAYRPAAPWSPRASGADRRLLARYRDRDGHEVDVFLALYLAQDEGREAGGFGEGALTPDSGWAWLSPGTSAPDAKTDRLLGPSGVERLAETRYRTGALLTGSNLRLKLANIADRLSLRARPTAMLILSAERRGETDPAASLRAFRASAGPLGAWMDRIAGVG